MALITTEMVYKELQETKKILLRLVEKDNENSIEEISLSKAARLLRLGSESVLDLVKCGKLKARTYKDSSRKLRYRFRVSDIREFQTNETQRAQDYHNLAKGSYDTHPNSERAEDIAKRVFG